MHITHNRASAHLLIAFMLLGPICSNAVPLTKTDSAKRRHYLQAAFRCDLFSVARNQYLDSALMIAPGDAYLWQQKAMPLYKQKKYELGAPFLDSAVRYNSEYLDYRGFMKCIFQRHYRSALQDFREAKTTLGDAGVMDHPYDFYIALCHLQLNAFDSAKVYLQKCIARRGGDENAHYLHQFYLGIVYMELGEQQAAIADFDQAIKKYPQFSDAEYYKALCLAANGDYTHALQNMESAQTHLAQGYSINEDNAFYEAYPYQVVRYYVPGYLRYLKEQVQGSGKKK